MLFICLIYIAISACGATVPDSKNVFAKASSPVYDLHDDALIYFSRDLEHGQHRVCYKTFAGSSACPVQVNLDSDKTFLKGWLGKDKFQIGISKNPKTLEIKSWSKCKLGNVKQSSKLIPLEGELHNVEFARDGKSFAVETAISTKIYNLQKSPKCLHSYTFLNHCSWDVDLRHGVCLSQGKLTLVIESVKIEAQKDKFTPLQWVMDPEGAHAIIYGKEGESENLYVWSSRNVSKIKLIKANLQILSLLAANSKRKVVFTRKVLLKKRPTTALYALDWAFEGGEIEEKLIGVFKNDHFKVSPSGTVCAWHKETRGFGKNYEITIKRLTLGSC